MFLILSLVIGNFLSSQVGVATDNGTIGTAVKVAPKQFLSAAHVASYPVPRFIECNSHLVQVMDVRMDVNHDLALFTTDDDCDIPIAEIAAKNPPRGADILVVGCPNGICGMVTKGIVSNYKVFKNFEYIMADATSWFGNSGGPVFHNGKLVGILHGIVCFGSDNDPKACYTLIVPANYIRAFLKL